MKLVLIPAGEFLMGAADSDDDAGNDEKPQHRVRITRPFYLGATMVTRRQYRAVTGADPRCFEGSDDLPVDQVSWEDAMAFCARLNELGRRQLGDAAYQLPTEAQWEYACRAGSQTRFSFGDDDRVLGYYGWFSRNSKGRTQPVGQKRANAWSLFDMHGNLWEWCWDAYDGSYYAKSPVDDPRGPDPAGAADRVNRGGCWLNIPRNCRSANRGWNTPGSRYNNVGFRVARVWSSP
jgi:formylglycine-generating enzyme required for sulfatase activity